MICMQKISLQNTVDDVTTEATAVASDAVSSNPASIPVVQKETTMAKKKSNPAAIVLLICAVIAGLATGAGAHSLSSSPTPQDAVLTQVGSPTDGIAVGEVYGAASEEGLKDSAEGVIQIGGLDGEGSHQLIRPGGVSQTVYLTSSSVDLDVFENARVKVWGETFAAQKAGWLMDVQRVSVIELNAPLPTEK